MKLLLIDGNSLLFRAYYATAYQGVDKIMRNKEGYPTNALYGLANIVTKVLNQSHPDYALVAFDTSKPTFRHQQYQDYKAGRAETPTELKQQFLPAREMLKLMGLYVYEIEGYEADDIIGTTSIMASEDIDVEIYSADKDLLQLIKPNVHVCLTKKGVTDLVIMDEISLKNEMGISPTQITDLKGLMGDKSDNIPGIMGVGEVTAIKLLNEYQCVEKIVDAEISGKLGEKIKAGKEIALMSKKLATINKEVPVSYTLEDLKYCGANQTKLSEFLRYYDMYSLDKKLVSKKETIKANYQIVNKIPLDFLNQSLAIFIDTNGLNYHIDEINGLSISNGNNSYFINRDNLIKDDNLIQYLSNDKYEKYGLDIKKIIVCLNRLDIKINSLNYDLLLATYLIESLVKEEPTMLLDYYGILIDQKEKSTSEGYLQSIAKYSCSIAQSIYKLKDKTLEKLKESNQLDLFNNVEIKLAYILAEMEIRGINVDKKLLEEKSKELNIKLEDIAKQIYQLAGYEFNINSPSQLAELLFDKLNLPANRKRSTSAEELEFLYPFHPIISKILEYRKFSKLLNTYFSGLQDYVLSDNKIHTIYNQALTQTGRLSSRDPNLQNISVRSEEGKEVRKAFVAKDGYTLCSFDYSQIELRVLAAMSNSLSLKEAFNNHIDVHAKTASLIFGDDINNVSEEHRRQAKTINFGIVYGMSNFELARELNIGFNQASDFINKYFEMYPEIKSYFSNVISECEKYGFVKTKFNRTRRIVEINSSVYNERERGKRIAMNTPIQGTAADIMKMQMIKVYESLKSSSLDASILLQVHDEIVLEIKDEDLDKTIQLVKEKMEEFDLIDVPLIIDYHYGKNWME